MLARWSALPVPPAAAALRAAGIASPLAELLAQRGVADADTARRFLAPGLEQLTPAAEIEGLAAAAERLVAAVTQAETILVVGDYDVDGVSATALMAASLGALGAHATTLLPRRDGEGYGLQAQHIGTAIAQGATLVVAVDSGTSAHGAWQAASDRGVDLVVVDHHLAAEGRQPLSAPGRWLLNPRLAEPTAASDATAAGLAARLCAELFERRGRDVPWDGLLRLAALGTIADVAPLRGDNRVLVSLGLAAMATTPSPGLRELLRLASVRPPLAASDVAFRLAPRLNAAGRLADAAAALELLLTRDAERAGVLAAQLETWNGERQSVERGILADAWKQLGGRQEHPGIVVLSSPRWHRGVVGVAAARLARELHRPIVLLAEEGSQATGSGRSVAGLPLYELLSPWRSELIRFGGHAQAIGMTVATERIDELRREWETAAEPWLDRLAERELRFDLDLRLADLRPELLDRVGALSPFGAGNPEPLFRIGPCVAAASPAAFGRGHLRLAVTDPAGATKSFPAVLWNGAERLEGRGLPPVFELLAAVERDLRGGLRLRIVDLRGFPLPND